MLFIPILPFLVHIAGLATAKFYLDSKANLTKSHGIETGTRSNSVEKIYFRRGKLLHLMKNEIM